LVGCLAGTSVLPQLWYATALLFVLTLPGILNYCAYSLATHQKESSPFRLYLLRCTVTVNRLFISVPGRDFAFWTVVFTTLLAAAQETRGLLAEAEVTWRSAQTIVLKYKIGDSWLLVTASALSALLGKQNRYAEEETFLRQILACQQNGPDKVNSSCDHFVILLSGALRAQKKYAEQALLTKERLAHSSGKKRALFLLSTTNALRSQKKQDEIVPLLRQELEQFAARESEDDFYRLRILSLLIKELYTNKKYEEANRLVGQVLELAASQSMDHIDLQLLINAVNPVLVQGRQVYDEEAERYGAQLLSLVEAAPVVQAARDQMLRMLVDSMATQAYVLYRRYKFEESLTINRRILALEQNLAQGQSTQGLLRADFTMGRCLRRLGRLTEATKHLSAALAMSPSVEWSQAFAMTICNIYIVLAEVKVAEGKPGDAQLLLDAAAPQRVRLAPESHTHLLFDKARSAILSAQGDLIQAEERVKACIEECERWPIKNDMTLTDLYLQYSEILAKAGRGTEAEAWAQRSRGDKTPLVLSGKVNDQ